MNLAQAGFSDPCGKWFDGVLTDLQKAAIERLKQLCIVRKILKIRPNRDD